MLRNYFVIAWRNLWRNKAFSLLNIGGLTLGLACSGLIFLWVNDEYRVDAFHSNKQRLYTVYEKIIMDDHVQAGYYTPAPLAAELQRTVPEIERAVTVRLSDDPRSFEANHKTLKEKGNYAADGYLTLFTYPLLAGNATTALQDPGNIVLTRKMAEDFFGSVQAAMGKTIRLEDRVDYRVAAVTENVPVHASSSFDFLLPWSAYIHEHPSWGNQWDSYSPRTYILLRPGADEKVVGEKIKDFLPKYNRKLNEHLRVELYLQRYDAGYLHSDFKDGVISGGRIEQVRLFGIVAVVVLLIACINFMNLTTALSLKRAREIGIRKVAGALRGGLIRQFIGEAILLVALAGLLSLGVVAWVLPAFNTFTGKEISLPLADPGFWGSAAALIVVTGVVSGGYPAFYLSSFDPVRVLKGAIGMGTRSGSASSVFGALGLRKGLVIFQFVLSITLIVGAIVISQQVNFIQSMDTGYDRKDLIYIPLEGKLPTEYALLRQEALRLPGVVGVTRMSSAPTELNNSTLGMDWDGKDPYSKSIFTIASAGYDFVKTMKLSLVQGRDFSREFATDSVGYLINETALGKIGYSDPIGKPLRLAGRSGTIIGVLKDFHFNSLHETIQPLVVSLGEEDTEGAMLVRVGHAAAGPVSTRKVLAGLDGICHRLNPAFPFTYHFADEEYRHLYRSEQVVNVLADLFALLAIGISCLGLLGLALYTAQQRTREIGIRKVLGASAGSVFGLLSKEFLVLVFIALMIAAPLGWWVMSRWLEEFAYRIDMHWTIIAIAGAVTMGIALATVSVQAVRAARTNPVKSLRSE